MRIKATIKVTFKAILAQWKQVLLVYALFPLLLSFIMGYVQKDIFRPEVTRDKINITIIDEDNSKSSQGLKELFSAEEIKDLFKVSDKGDYIITIPKEYENNLIGLKDTTINIDEKKDISRDNELIIKAILDQYGKSLTESIVIANKIEQLDLQDKEKVFKEVKSNLEKALGTSALKTNLMKGERALSSFENQAATMMSFMLFSMILSCVAGYHLDKENGSFKRLLSTSITRATFFNLDLLIFFLSSVIYGAIYIISFRLLGFAFKGVNPLNIIAILIGQSLMVTAIAGIMIAFFKKDNANLVLVVFMYFQIIFGGGFVPLKDMTSKVFLTLSKFAPGNIITEAYKSCMIFNSFDKIYVNLIAMILFSVVIYSISILKIKIRWEE